MIFLNIRAVSTSFHVCQGVGGQDLLEVWQEMRAMHVALHRKGFANSVE